PPPPSYTLSPTRRSSDLYLLSLCLRKEEAFGPLALEFARNNDLDRLGLLPEEQFNLWMALSDAFAEEPKRFKFKLEALQKAVERSEEHTSELQSPDKHVG